MSASRIDIKVHHNTIRKRLIKSGLFGRVALRMLDIMVYLDKGASQQTTGQLKLFPLDRQDQSWDECPWCIVFLAKKTPNKAYQQKHLMPTVSYDGGRVMFWLCFAAWGSAPWLWGLLKTSWVDHELHESDVRPCVWQIKHGRNWVIQQDNELSSNCKVTSKTQSKSRPQPSWNAVAGLQ